ncbi:MAG: single-stranded DNA-binding protein [Bacteroidota bacterium]|nr:single-stranded DNA-binding protein [Bacteroidota bacterium]
MIKIQIIGHLGKDCVVNTVNGKTVINFTVAHSEKYKDSSGNQQEKTTWVDCAYWTDRTAVAPYLTKGTQVYTEGTPEVRSFQRNDGTAGASLSMRVRDVQLLGRKGEGSNMGNTNANSDVQMPSRQESPATTPADETSDDLPF